VQRRPIQTPVCARASLTNGDPVADALPTQAYHRLRELLVSGRLAPGFRIVEAEVAARLGISRTPARSALQRLHQEGFIDTSGTGRATRWVVAAMTEEDARELFNIVGAVEGLAAHQAADQGARARQPLVARLREQNEALRREALRERPDHNALFELDAAFHRSIVETAGGPRLIALHDAIKPQAERYARLYTTALVYEIDESVEEHALVTLEIERGEAMAARRAMEANWRNAGERLGNVVRTLGERGSW
jgi:DNA-binding GntR family transcriptional regulator